MLYRWRTRRKRERFYRQTGAILDTSPVEIKDAPWSIVSMVGNDDVQMYLLSMKSLYARLGRGKISALVARDMPSDGRHTLERHFHGIKILIRDDIDTGTCQRGGCWERLVFLLDHAETEYAIQMDCDTLAFGSDVDEVRRCAENNIAFTLGNAGRPIETMMSIGSDARLMPSNHISIVSERHFDQFPDAQHTRYVRASAAFAGFAKGAFPRKRIEEFHRVMRDLIGKRWNEWGSEQCGSNFAIANSPDAVVLPYPKYANFWPGLTRDHSSFLHFFGTHRYNDDYFATLGRVVIGELLRAKQ